jgi:hypothetical protein
MSVQSIVARFKGCQISSGRFNLNEYDVLGPGTPNPGQGTDGGLYAFGLSKAERIDSPPSIDYGPVQPRDEQIKHGQREARTQRGP